MMNGDGQRGSTFALEPYVRAVLPHPPVAELFEGFYDFSTRAARKVRHGIR